jgi:uncharacterized damage-inducible protein DinB
LHATLTHTLHAEWLWLQRWQGRSPQEFPSNDALATIYDIRQRWEKQERDLRAFLAAQSEQSLTQTVAYKNTKGEDFELPLYQMMVHVVNHATHHRAEIAEMLAQIEVAHPGDDMNVFFLERSGQLYALKSKLPRRKPRRGLLSALIISASVVKRHSF